MFFSSALYLNMSFVNVVLFPVEEVWFFSEQLLTKKTRDKS